MQKPLFTMSEPEKVPILKWADLTSEERDEFDHLTTPAERDEAQFCRYTGEVFCLTDMDDAQPTLARLGGWQLSHQKNLRFGTVFKIVSEDVAEAATFAM